MLKVGVISQARIKSTRLPGKVLKLINARPMMSYHIERLTQSQLPIVLAISNTRDDHPLVDFCKSQSIPYFQGSETHVLSRFYEAAKLFKLDVVVRVTSDCPLIDGQLVKEGVEQYLKLNNENIYFSNCLVRTFPRGMDFEIFSFKLLEEAFQNADKDYETEHVTPYINQNRSGHVVIKHFLNPNGDTHQYRLTVDQQEDFILIEKLIVDHHADKKSIAEIESILKQDDSLARLNSFVEQKKI